MRSLPLRLVFPPAIGFLAAAIPEHDPAVHVLDHDAVVSVFEQLFLPPDRFQELGVAARIRAPHSRGVPPRQAAATRYWRFLSNRPGLCLARSFFQFGRALSAHDS